MPQAKKNNGEVKAKIKLGLSSLISNGACVELGRNHSWIGAVVVGLLSVLLAIIPIGVSRAWVNGSDFFATPTYGYEVGLVHFEDAVSKNDVSILIDHDTETLTATGFDKIQKGSQEPWYQYVNSVTGAPEFEVYYTTAEGTDFTSFITALVTNGENPYNEIARNYSCNLLILGTKEFRAYKYQYASITTSSASSDSSSTTVASYVLGQGGKYDITPTFDIKDLVKQDTHGNLLSLPYSEVNEANIDTYITETLNTWKTFFDDAYYSTKVTSAWTWTGIMAAVFAGFILFMGLMVFFMTRGKNNPYRIYTFWETQKIAYWAAGAPAILALGLGFAFTTYAIFMFIFLYGMRVMWLSMKTLRPEVASK